MIRNKAQRKRIKTLLPWNYRTIIVDRLAEQGIKVHPNTVSNVLKGSDNKVVETALLRLYYERKKEQESLDKTILDTAA